MKLRTLLILTALIISISIWFNAIHLIDGHEHWFQRSGALLVILGAIFESKYILRSPDENKTAVVGMLTIYTEEEADNSRKFKFKTHAGFYIIFLGTLIWGYGDIVTHYLP